MPVEGGWEWLDLLPLALFITGMIGVVGPCVSYGYLPGNAGDSRLNLYLLEDFFQSLRGTSAGFTDAPFFYPWPDTIGFSDTHWGTAPIYSLFRCASLGTMDAYVGWFVTGNILNYISAYFVLRWFGLKQIGAGIGAYLFSFSLPASAQFDHTQLTYRYAVPLTLYFFHAYLTQRKPNDIVLTVLFGALQMLASLYLGIFLVYLLGCWFCAWIWFAIVREKVPVISVLKNLWPDWEGKPFRASTIVLTAIALVLAALALYPNFEAKSLYNFKRGWPEIWTMLPRPQSYFLADHSWIWSSQAREFAGLPMRWEHQMFLGGIAALAIGFATFFEKYSRPVPAFYLMRMTFYFMVVLTVCVFDSSLYYVVMHLPGFNAVRAVTRIILVMAFPAAFLLGIFVEDISNRGTRGVAWRALAVILIIGCVTETMLTNKFRTPRADWISRIDALEARLHDAVKRPLQKGDVLISAAPEELDGAPFTLNEVDAMILSQKLGIRTLNGYSGNRPSGWRPMRQIDEIEDNILEGDQFRKNRGLAPVEIKPANLLLVGFKDVPPDPAGLFAGPHAGDLAEGMSFTVTDHQQDFPQRFLGAGWSWLDPTSVWSDGKEADLLLNFAAPGAKKIALDLAAYVPQPNSVQSVEIFANDISVAKFTFTQQANRGKHNVDLPANLDAIVLLRIVMEKPLSPSANLTSDDDRKLGVCLYGFDVMAASH